LPVITPEGSVDRSLKSSISEWLHPKVHVINQKVPDAHTLMKPLSVESEAIRDLRTALLSPRAQNAPRIILISSSMEGEGKTTVATNFAVALSQLGRTCLVDGDLRRPAVTRAFGIMATSGLSEVLRGTMHLSDALVSVAETCNLWILPGGEPAESPADVLASLQIDTLCAELRKVFDYVVIDSPPVIRFSDARFLSHLADEVVLVGRYGVSTRRAMQRSVELLREVDAPIAGVVLNAIDLSSPDYHYFTYGYSKGIDRQADERSELPPSPPFGSSDAQQEKSKSAHA
jgi:capsular exopolysaccharide synthesis family protein